MVSKPEPQVPSSAIVAQKLAERAARAAALVAQFEAEKAAALAPASRALRCFRWLPLQAEQEAQASVTIAGAAGVHTVRVSAYRMHPLEPERWLVEARCDCPDEWGHRWCGTCKHELAARALVARALAAGCRPHAPRPPVQPVTGALVGRAAELAAARADAVVRHGVAFPVNLPEAA